MRRCGNTYLVGITAALVIVGGIVFPLVNRLKNLPDSNGVATSESPALASSPLLQQATLEEIKDRLQTSKSTITLVNLWASWCGPCKVEFPGLLKLREKLKNRGFDLLLVSLDHEEQREEALEFLKEQKVDFLSFIKGSQSTGFMQPLFPQWQGAIPASFLVNTDLQILEGWIGETKMEQFESKILRHLPKQ